MNKSLLAYLLTSLRNTTTTTKLKQEGHTTQIVYSKEDWVKFKHLLELEGTNTNRFLWNVVQIIIEQYDQKEHSLDKFLIEPELLLPTIDTEPEKVLKYLQSLPMEEVKQYEEKLMRDYIYTKALTQGEIELDNFPYLWRKYQ